MKQLKETASVQRLTDGSQGARQASSFSERFKRMARRAGEVLSESLDESMLTSGPLSVDRELPLRDKFKAIREHAKKHPGETAVNAAILTTFGGLFLVSTGAFIYSSVNNEFDKKMAPKSLSADDDTLRYRRLKYSEGEGVVTSPASSGAIVRDLVSDVPHLLKDGASYLLSLPGRREPIRIEHGTTQPSRESGKALERSK